jgi:hypothetical protein
MAVRQNSGRTCWSRKRYWMLMGKVTIPAMETFVAGPCVRGIKA